jgi:hypothetical protein
MQRWVDIQFDCLPLRSVTRLDIPLDASPKYRARCERIKNALEKHGAFNSYYLHNGRCVYHLLNCEQRGTLEFIFEGTVVTDGQDVKTQLTDLIVSLAGETCDWLTESVKLWFSETVARSVAVEFDRYIEAGDLEKTRQRIATITAQSDDAGGFVGMYL